MLYTICFLYTICLNVKSILVKRSASQFSYLLIQIVWDCSSSVNKHGRLYLFDRRVLLNYRETKDMK